MKDITSFLFEQLESHEVSNIKEGKISSEKEFKEAAKAKFEEVFGDDLDEDKMNDTINGILDDNKDLVDNGEWDKLIGMLNKSFAN